MKIGGIPEIKSANQAPHFTLIYLIRPDNKRKFIIHKKASLPPLDLSRFQITILSRQFSQMIIALLLYGVQNRK
jgi:hypothetical protein